MIRHWLLGLCLLLGACAAPTPVPQSVPALVADLPLTLHIQRTQAAVAQDWLLVLQAEGASLRWSLLDPLGVPLARQLFSNGEWHNDGLLPPNPEARELFAVLLFALSSEAAVVRNYPAGSWQVQPTQRQLAPDWSITYRTPLDFTVRGTALSYQVRTLPAEDF